MTARIEHPGTSSASVRVALLLESSSLPAWKHDLIRVLRSSPSCTIVGALAGSEPWCPDEPFPPLRHAPVLYKLLRTLDVRRFRSRVNAFERRDARNLLEGIPVCTGSLATPDEAAIRHLRSWQPDVLVHLGREIPASTLHGIAPFGIWMNDIALRESDTPPAGFWEVLHGKPTTVTSVFRADLPSRPELTRSLSPTDQFSIIQNRNRIAWKALYLIPRLLRQLAQNRKGTAGLPDFTPVAFLHQHQGGMKPRNRSLLVPMTRLVSRTVARRLRRLLFLDQWILLFTLDKGSAGDLTTFRPMIPPKGVTWADPFIWQKDGRYYLFLEECPLMRKRGRISVITVDENGSYSAPRPVIEQPYHLSYPFLFTWNDQLYMIPESSAHRTIDVYMCVEFPWSWKHEKTLMQDIDAVDTTLLHAGDRWWMFVTLRENQGYQNWEELFLFHAADPLSDAWTPHPENPVVSDVASARPAGKIIVRDGRVFRPAQDCSVRYGYGLRMQEIIVLTTEQYREAEVSCAEPLWNRSLVGVHTYARTGNLTVIDAVHRRRRLM